MKIQKKEIITGILVPIIVVCISLMSTKNWEYLLIITTLLLIIVVWIFFENKKRATILITVITIIVLVGGLFYGPSNPQKTGAQLLVEPIQLIDNNPKDTTDDAPASVPILNATKVNYSHQSPQERQKVDSVKLGNDDDGSWKLSQITLSQIVTGDEVSYKKDMNDWNIFDRNLVDTLFKMRLPILDIEINYDNLTDEKHWKTTFPLIICTIRNDGEKSGTIYGLISHNIAELQGITAQSSVPLIPLNSNCRLYPNRNLMFKAPILLPKNAVATIQFSPTFREKDFYLKGTPPRMLFSVSAIYFDGFKKSQVLIGYYLVEEAITD